MKQKLQTWFSVIISATLIINTFAFSALAQTQRPRRASDVEVNRLSAGVRFLPRGYVLLLRMDTRLDSNRVRPSDRFHARLDEAQRLRFRPERKSASPPVRTA